jgi:hypothetical protein
MKYKQIFNKPLLWFDEGNKKTSERSADSAQGGNQFIGEAADREAGGFLSVYLA